MYCITETTTTPRMTLVKTVFTSAAPNWVKNVETDLTALRIRISVSPQTAKLSVETSLF